MILGTYDYDIFIWNCLSNFEFYQMLCSHSNQMLLIRILDCYIILFLEYFHWKPDIYSTLNNNVMCSSYYYFQIYLCSEKELCFCFFSLSLFLCWHLSYLEKSLCFLHSLFVEFNVYEKVHLHLPRIYLLGIHRSYADT